MSGVIINARGVKCGGSLKIKTNTKDAVIDTTGAKCGGGIHVSVDEKDTFRLPFAEHSRLALNPDDFWTAVKSKVDDSTSQKPTETPAEQKETTFITAVGEGRTVVDVSGKTFESPCVFSVTNGPKTKGR